MVPMLNNSALIGFVHFWKALDSLGGIREFFFYSAILISFVLCVFGLTFKYI